MAFADLLGGPVILVIVAAAGLSLPARALDAKWDHVTNTALLSVLGICAFVFFVVVSLGNAFVGVPLALMAMVATPLIGSLFAIREDYHYTVGLLRATVIAAVAIYCASLLAIWRRRKKPRPSLRRSSPNSGAPARESSSPDRIRKQCGGRSSASCAPSRSCRSPAPWCSRPCGASGSTCFLTTTPRVCVSFAFVRRPQPFRYLQLAARAHRWLGPGPRMRGLLSRVRCLRRSHPGKRRLPRRSPQCDHTRPREARPTEPRIPCRG
jgi:hypothetical protein